MKQTRSLVPVAVSCLLLSVVGFAQTPGEVTAKPPTQDKKQAPPKPTPAIQKLLEDALKLSPKDRLAALEDALPMAQASKDVIGEATLCGYCGIYAASTGQPLKGRSYFERALSLLKGIEFPAAEAITLSNLGRVYIMLGEQSKALDSFALALPIQRKIRDRVGESMTLINIGLTYYALGQHTRALEYDESALGVVREVRNRNLEAIVLNNIGLIYNILGQKSKAIENFRLALPIERETQNRGLEATTLMGTGLAYSDLDQKLKALAYYQTALSLRQQMGDRSGEAESLTNIADAFNSLGKKAIALGHYERALPIRRDVGDRIGEASTLTGIGHVYLDMKKPAKALDYFNQALPIVQIVGARAVEDAILGDIGKAYFVLGINAKAANYWQKSLPIAREVGDRRTEATVLSSLSSLNSKERPSLAIWYGKRAVNLCQSLRKDITSLDKETQKTFKNSIVDAYRSLASLLAKQGRIGEAEQVLRLLKDDELYEYVRRSDAAIAGAKAEYTSAESAWDKEYEAQTQELAYLARQAEDMRRGSQKDDAKLKGLMARLDEGEARFQKFLDRVLEKSKTLNVKENRIERIRDAQSIADTLAVLPKATVAVYALAAPDALRLFYFAPGTSLARVSIIKGEDLNRKVLAFREALTDPTADPRPIGKEFYDLLVKPIEKDLAGSKAKRIMWSLDGMLRYIPISALYDGRQFLIEKYDVSIFTPAGSARLERNPKTSWKALAAGVSLAHTVTDDDGSVHRFDALSGVPGELAGVMRALPGGTTLLDKNFTLVSFKDALGKRPNLVHLATHFSFQPGDETNSYLLTGEGKPLKVADARSLSTLSMQGVSLLTLSACETALGGSDGSEVEGISAVLQKKGAEAVVATLWPVADSSTASMMSEFYRLRKAHPEWSKLHALQAAQLELLRGQIAVKKGPTRSEAVSSSSKKTWPKSLPPYSHPYYWAPFVLMGNWK